LGYRVKLNIFIKFFLIIFLCASAAGCATAPKARTVGEKVGATIGGGIDTSITWASEGIKKILNK